MIYINANYEKHIIEINFKGDNFYEILSFFKSSYDFKYNPDNKSWYAEPHVTYFNLDEIKGLDKYLISKSALKLMEKDIASLKELKKLRIPFKEKYLALPPIKGKSPFEDYQTDCIKKGISQNRLAYFLGLGSGKTYIMSNVINHYINMNLIDKALIVCTPEILYNWKYELLRFNSFNLKEDDIYIANRYDRSPFQNEKITIMTYRTFLMVCDDIKKTKIKKAILPLGNWGKDGRRLICLDESHKIKNKDTRTLNVIMKHKDYFEYRYIMTGTSTPNQFTDIYTQIKFLDKSKVPNSFFNFQNEVMFMKEKQTREGRKYRIPIYPFKDKIEKYEKSFDDIVIKMKSEDILDLPELIMKKSYVGMSPIQKDIYQGIVKHTLKVIKEKEGFILTKQVMNKFPYIKLAVDNPEILKDKISKEENPYLHDLIKKFKFEKDCEKVDVLKYIVESWIEEGKKVIIFDYHPITLNSLAKIFKKYNPPVLHGQIDIPKGIELNEYKSQVVDDFKRDKKKKLLIASYLVLETGVNLQEVTRGVYFARSDNYGAWYQSSRRFYRLGTQESVIIQNLVFEKSIDVTTDKRLDNKGKLNSNLFSKDSLSKKELEDLFMGEV